MIPADFLVWPVCLAALGTAVLLGTNFFIVCTAVTTPICISWVLHMHPVVSGSVEPLPHQLRILLTLSKFFLSRLSTE